MWLLDQGISHPAPPFPLPNYYCTVNPGLGSPYQHVSVPEHDLTPAVTHVFFRHGHFVAPLQQTVNDLRRQSVLQIDLSSPHPLPAGRIQGCLGVMGKVDEVHHNLDMPLGLHKPTHDAKGTHRLAVLAEEAGNNCMVGTFVRL